MFIFIGNFKGTAFAAVALGITFAVESIDESVRAEWIAGLTLFTIDLGYRVVFLRPKPTGTSVEGAPPSHGTTRDAAPITPARIDWKKLARTDLDKFWLLTLRGGHLFFLPAWSVGLLFQLIVALGVFDRGF